MVGKLRINQTVFGIRIVTTPVLALLISAAVFAQARPQKPAPTPEQTALDLERMNMRKGVKPPTGPSFYISPVEGTASNFSVLLADGGGNTVAGTFTLQQIEAFSRMALELFALTLWERSQTKKHAPSLVGRQVQIRALPNSNPTKWVKPRPVIRKPGWCLSLNPP